MLLQEKLDGLSTELAGKIPADTLATMHQATEDLIASRQAERAAKAGELAPVFALPDADGKLVSSTNLLRTGPIVVTFYRGVWCPFCNLDLQALEEAAEAIRSRGATLVAISQQSPANSRKSQRTNDLSFPILADVGGEVANAFGIRWALTDELQKIYKALGADLPSFNSEPSWTLPMPARYVIDRDGVIAYAEINADYTRRPEPRELLPILDRLKAAANR